MCIVCMCALCVCVHCVLLGHNQIMLEHNRAQSHDCQPSSSCSIMAIKAKNVSISWKHN